MTVQIILKNLANKNFDFNGELFAVSLSIVDSVPNSAHGHINSEALYFPKKQNKGVGPICPRVRTETEREGFHTAKTSIPRKEK
jgi:hypothetical protein